MYRLYPRRQVRDAALSGPDHVSGIAVGGGRGADRRVQPCPTVMDVGLMRPACAIDAWCHAGRPRGGAARPSRHSRPHSAPREVSLSPPRGNRSPPTYASIILVHGSTLRAPPSPLAERPAAAAAAASGCKTRTTCCTGRRRCSRAGSRRAAPPRRSHLPR